MKCTKCGAEIKAEDAFCGECGTVVAESSVQTTKKSSGMSENTKGALCYLLGWITGIIFLLTEKDNKFIRFHAVQSIIFSLALWVLTFLVEPRSYYDDYTLYGFVIIIELVLWVLLMYKAYQGKKYKLPVIGDIAESKA